MNLVAGIGAGLFWGLFTIVRGRRNLAKVERSVRARRAGAARTAYRVPNADEASLVALLRCAEGDEKMLQSCGFTRLGDLVIDEGNRSALGIMRAFVDGPGTTCAYLLVTPGDPAVSMLLLESYTHDSEYMSLRAAKRSGLAQPPFSYRQFLPDLPFDQVVAQHRAFVPFDQSGQPFRSIASFDELVHELARNQALTINWREAQSPEALLEADLRALLGDRYQRLGKKWKRRLAPTVPRATARRGPPWP